jgi:quinol monooxygenase YgiN
MSFKVSAIVSVHSGKMPQFREVAEKCQILVKQNEELTNTEYGWWLQANEQMTCEVREAYIDQQAFLTHLANIEALLTELLEYGSLVSVKIYTYEELSAQLREVVTKLGAEVYHPL